MNELTIVTGGTGWVGRNFLHQIQKEIPAEQFNNKVKVFGSKESEILSTAYSTIKQIKIPIYPLNSLNKMFNKTKRIYLIHSAFIRREKLSNMSINNYIKINRQITNIICKFITSNQNCKVLNISSGAASNFDNTKNGIQSDPYGFLKFESEKKLGSISNCLQLRIFSLTGKFITSPELFAFGDFLISAVKKKPIKIKARNQVIRSYGFASDIAKFGLHWLRTVDPYPYKSEVINTATDTVSLHELANKITEIYNLQSVNQQINYQLKPDKYTCDTNQFKNMLSRYKIPHTSINNQILETYKYLSMKYSN